MKQMPTREINKNIEIELERQFPKGKCKERGKALVLFASAQNEIDKVNEKMLKLKDKLDKLKGGYTKTKCQK